MRRRRAKKTCILLVICVTRDGFGAAIYRIKTKFIIAFSKNIRKMRLSLLSVCVFGKFENIHWEGSLLWLEK
jgi:hypothetical protein